MPYAYAAEGRRWMIIDLGERLSKVCSSSRPMSHCFLTLTREGDSPKRFSVELYEDGHTLDTYELWRRIAQARDDLST